jgi:hypothetical protein
MASTWGSEDLLDNMLSVHDSQFKHVWATNALLKHVYMPTAFLVEITLEKIMVITLSTLFLLLQGLISRWAYFATSFKTFQFK